MYLYTVAAVFVPVAVFDIFFHARYIIIFRIKILIIL